MSSVTGILICHSTIEDWNELPNGSEEYYIIEEINDFLKKHNHSALHRLDEYMCNGKHPQMVVWGGGYNYLSNNDFLDFFKNRKWNEPEEAFLIFNPEGGPIQVIRPITEQKGE